jgi:hypothetical protein
VGIGRFAGRLSAAALAAALGAAAPAFALEECPYKPNAVALEKGQSLDCTCSEILTGVSIYGTDVYTADSYTCLAAMHAGVIGEEGGPVTIHVGGGCKLFTGSERNGVTSRDYGKYPQTIAFALPFPPCADETHGAGAEDRLMRDCAARGEPLAYCQCQTRELLEQHKLQGVEFLYEIYDAVNAAKRGPALAEDVAKALQKLGLNVYSLAAVKEQVAGDLSRMKACPR